MYWIHTTLAFYDVVAVLMSELLSPAVTVHQKAEGSLEKDALQHLAVAARFTVSVCPLKDRPSPTEQAVLPFIRPLMPPQYSGGIN